MLFRSTVSGPADVGAYIATVSDERQRADAEKLCAIFSRVTGHPPVLWGPSIIGFGSYHYRYDSGREGDMCRIGFSPRKGNTVLYIIGGFPSHADILARLGKHKTGKSCLYVKWLDDLNMAALEELISKSWAEMAKRYPD